MIETPRDAKRVAESTFQAVAFVLRTHGTKRLNDPWLTYRLANYPMHRSKNWSRR